MPLESVFMKKQQNNQQGLFATKEEQNCNENSQGSDNEEKE